MSFCLRCSSATSRASCSFWPRSLAMSPRSVSIWLFSSSRLRLQLADLLGQLRICSAWRARACSLLCSSCWRRSRIAWRASSSSNRPACAGGAHAAHSDAARRARAASARSAAQASRSLQLGAAVLGPGRFVAALRRRPFLAEAHRLDLAVGSAQQRQRLGAPPRRAAGRARGCTRGRRARRCGLRSPSCWSCGWSSARLALRLDHRPEFVLHDVAVEVEVDDARRGCRAGRARRR